MAHILVIDDDASMRRALRSTLEHQGHEVAEASEGKAGLKAYRDSAFDLVITDIIMPGMEGLETVMALKKVAAQAKIIAMSAGGTGSAHDYLDLARRFGAVRTVRKPFTSEEIRAAVDDVLGVPGGA